MAHHRSEYRFGSRRLAPRRGESARCRAVGATVTVLNQKGGVGKSTVVLGLTSAARARGHRVLVVDLDPQAASSWVLGVEPDRVRRSVHEVLSSGRSGAARDAIVGSEWGHLVDVLPSVGGLQAMESIKGGGLDQLLRGSKPTVRLRKALEGVTDSYGVVLIDCPPSLGDLTTNGLAAANQAIVVVEPAALSLRGVAPVADLIESVWERDNGELDLAGVIVNRMPARSRDAHSRYDELSRTVGAESVWEPAIPYRVVLAEAAAAREPIHDMGSRGRDVAEVFDALYDRLWSIIAPRSRRR